MRCHRSCSFNYWQQTGLCKCWGCPSCSLQERQSPRSFFGSQGIKTWRARKDKKVRRIHSIWARSWPSCCHSGIWGLWLQEYWSSNRWTWERDQKFCPDLARDSRHYNRSNSRPFCFISLRWSLWQVFKPRLCKYSEWSSIADAFNGTGPLKSGEGTCQRSYL